jgi:hypothetical protein
MNKTENANMNTSIFKKLPKELTNHILSYDDRFFIYKGQIKLKQKYKYKYEEEERGLFCTCCFCCLGFWFFIFFFLIFRLAT